MCICYIGRFIHAECISQFYMSKIIICRYLACTYAFSNFHFVTIGWVFKRVCYLVFMVFWAIDLMTHHSLIREVLIQSCSARAKDFTNYVFCHPQFSGVIQILKIIVPFWLLFVYVDYYQNNQFYRVNRFFKIFVLMAQQFSIFG